MSWLERARTRPGLLLVGGLAALVAVLVLGVGLGSVWVAPDQTVAILVRRLLGLDLGLSWSPAAETIVVDLRLPRVLSAMVVGLGLAIAGATFQGILRNPLADPYVLGTASGAALGAAIAVLIPVRLLLLEFGLVQALAFLGALLRGRRGLPLQPDRAAWRPLTSLLLTGYAVGSLLAAGLAMAMYLSGTNLRQIFFYLLGGFDGSSWLRLGAALRPSHRGGGAIPVRARVPQRLPARRGGRGPPRRRRSPGAGDPAWPRLAHHRGGGRRSAA